MKLEPGEVAVLEPGTMGYEVFQTHDRIVDASHPLMVYRRIPFKRDLDIPFGMNADLNAINAHDGILWVEGNARDIVTMPDGGLTTIQGCWPAHRAGINVRANVRAFDEQLSPIQAERL